MMGENVEGVEPVAETIKYVLKEFSCRLCLFRHKGNILISSTDIDLVENISKHLSLQVKRDQFPIWICKFCKQSLESFHRFHDKVKQIHESLTGLLSAIKKGNYGESPSLDAELDVIETTVGFARGKKVRSPQKSKKVETAQRTSRRVEVRKLNDEKRQQVILAAVERGKESTNPSENLDDTSCQPSTFKTNALVKTDVTDVIKKEKSEDILPPTNEQTLENVPKAQERATPNDELSSLEDQDWVGHQVTLAADSDADHTWKPNNTGCHRGRPSRKRKLNCQDEMVPVISDKTDVSDDALPDPKKVKLRITATHGTEPKPKVPAEVRKMLREEMNARFVEFYGITCDICVKNIRNNSVPTEPVKYQSFEDLCIHMQSEHNERGYLKCCNCTMREKKRAERHMLLHTEPGSIFKCNICGKQLSSQQSFRCHILLHLPDAERPFQCNQCDRGFVSKADLNAHERQHLPEDKRLQYTCDVCGRRFSYETGLMIHKQRVHQNIRPYLCDLCAKSFSSRADMERHRAQIHGNVKREKCPECGKWFKGPSILKSHMQQHKGTLFKCQFCDRVYTVRSSWKAHLRMHSDEKHYKCPVCEKSFKLPGTLKMHLNQHTGDLPYACQFCPKKFASSGNYYTHRRRMHGDEVAQMKKATAAALAADGLPPASSMPPPTVTQSMSDAIARTKEIVAAKAKETASQVSPPDVVVENGGTSVSNPTILNSVDSLNVVRAPSIMQCVPIISESHGDVETSMPTSLDASEGDNGVILMQSGGGIPLAISSLNVANKVLHVIPSLKVSPNINPATIVAGGLKVVRVISTDGTSKLMLV